MSVLVSLHNSAAQEAQRLRDLGAIDHQNWFYGESRRLGPMYFVPVADIADRTALEQALQHQKVTFEPHRARVYSDQETLAVPLDGNAASSDAMTVIRRAVAEFALIGQQPWLDDDALNCLLEREIADTSKEDLLAALHARSQGSLSSDYRHVENAKPGNDVIMVLGRQGGRESWVAARIRLARNEAATRLIRTGEAPPSADGPQDGVSEPR